MTDFQARYIGQGEKGDMWDCSRTNVVPIAHTQCMRHHSSALLWLDELVPRGAEGKAVIPDASKT